MGVPKPCQQLNSDIKALEDQITQIQNSPGFIQGPDGPHPGKPDPADLAEVKALQTKLTAKVNAFHSCLLKNVAPFPVKIIVNAIRCEKGTSEIGDDEPYVIATACDLSPVVPQIESTLYGPVTMGTGEVKYPAGKPFWFIDNATGKVIPDPANVIFILSLMENDDGSPDAARGLVKAATTASLANSLALPRAQRVKKLQDDIDSTLAIPTGAPNIDDQIGNSIELAPSKLDLILPILGTHTVQLKFSGNGTYVIDCDITQA
jgi:hypothetical protein